jgi:hypothetical protein
MYRLSAATMTADALVPSAFAFATAASQTSSGTRTGRTGVGTSDRPRAELLRRSGAGERECASRTMLWMAVGVAFLPATVPAPRIRADRPLQTLQLQVMTVVSMIRSPRLVYLQSAPDLYIQSSVPPRNFPAFGIRRKATTPTIKDCPGCLTGIRRQVRVPLGRRDRLVAEEVLHLTDRHSGLHQPRRVRVPKIVGRTQVIGSFVFTAAGWKMCRENV